MWEQMQQFMLMVARQNQVSLSPKFPPRERLEPILIGSGVVHGPTGTSETEEPAGRETFEGRRQGVQTAQFLLCMPLPKMEIIVFDEQKLRWWVRRCERLFSVYNISEQHRVTLASACLNDVGDAWFQG